jgi:hypothetical protein
VLGTGERRHSQHRLDFCRALSATLALSSSKQKGLPKFHKELGFSWLFTQTLALFSTKGFGWRSCSNSLGVTLRGPAFAYRLRIESVKPRYLRVVTEMMGSMEMVTS